MLWHSKNDGTGSQKPPSFLDLQRVSELVLAGQNIPHHKPPNFLIVTSMDQCFPGDYLHHRLESAYSSRTR